MAMPIIKTLASYQGYPLQGVEYRRSEGLSPDRGFVEMDYELVQDILLKWGDVPWRPATKVAVAGGLSAQTWFDRVGNTIATGDVDKSAIVPPPGKLGLFGDLVLRSMVDGEWRPAQVYSDIYVDDSGIEEVLEDLARAREHKFGTLRIPITDIRKFNADYGTTVQRINCKLESGQDDPYSLKNGKTMWSAEEVIRYLFSQLPGSPSVLGDSELFSLKLAPPTGIHLRGEPGVVMGTLSRLIDTYRLSVKLTRSNNYLVGRRGSERLAYGAISPDAGKSVAIVGSHLLSDERKTVTVTNRPWAVHVFGKPPIRRITLYFTAIFQDTNKRYYQLTNVHKVWKGYSFAKAGKQRFVGHEKNYRDVPPFVATKESLAGGGVSGSAQSDLAAAAQAEGGNLSLGIMFGGGAGGSAAVTPQDYALHAERRRLAQKWFFKGYAPAILFEDANIDDNGVPFLTDADLERVWFLPMEDCGIYEDELDEISRVIPRDDANAPGDNGPFRIMPPVVQANRIGEGLFRSWQDVESHFGAIIKTANLKLDALEDQVKFFTVMMVSSNDEVLAAQAAADAAKSNIASKLDSQVLRGLLNQGQAAADLIGVGKDYNKNYGVGFLDYLKSQQKDMEDKKKQALHVQSQRKAELERLGEEIKKAKVALNEQLERFAAFKKIQKALGGVYADGFKVNLPHGVVEQGEYTIDRELGIILFHDPACHMIEPFVQDGDSATGVAEDGKVLVTFGYELKGNTMADITNVILIASSNEDAAIPVVAGINRSTITAAKIEQAPQMRMYQADLGSPFNVGKCIEQALMACGSLGGPRVVYGYVYTFEGILKLEMDGGTTMVQYVWDGDRAQTLLFVNAPNSDGPLGPAKLNPPQGPAGPRAAAAAAKQISTDGRTP